MRLVVDLVVAGIMVGTLYGLVAVTLTLMLRSSGILSFAHAGFALTSAYLYAGLECPKGTGNQQCGPSVVPPWAAALIAIGVATLIALVVERFVARPLERASAASKVIATAAVLGLISGVLLQMYGPQPRYTPNRQILPKGSFDVAGVVISWQRFAIFLVSVTVITLVGLLLRRSWFGLSVRAAGQLPDVARLMGVSPVTVSRFNWGLGGLLAGLAGVLIGPVTVVNIGTFSFLLVKAVGATLIGGLVSLPFTFVGGIGIGVAEAVVPHYWKTPGTAAVATAAVVLGMLYLYGKRFATLGYAGPTHQVATARSRPAVAAARGLCGLRDVLRVVPKPVWILVGAGGLAVPFKSAYFASVGVSSLYFCLIALSILVFTGTTGSLTFMQAGFAAIGAFGLATALKQGWSFPVALGVTVAACAVIGVVVGMVSLRFRGLEFAIASVAIGAVLSEFVVTRPGVATSVPSPEIFGRSLLDSRNLYGLALVLTAVALLLVANLRRSYWGRTLTAMQEMHTRVAHFGIAPVRAEVALLALSASLAGLSGAFLGVAVVALDPFLFVPILSVTMVLAGVVGGLSTLWGPIVAGLVFGVGQEVVGRAFSGHAANAFPQIASAALALVLVVKMPGGLATIFDWAADVVSGAARPAAPRLSFRGRVLDLRSGAGGAEPSVDGALSRRRAGLARPRRLGEARPAVVRFVRAEARTGLTRKVEVGEWAQR